MKQGIGFTMPVKIDIDFNTVEKIEFVFKRQKNRMDDEMKTATYPGDVIRKEGENVVLIPWSREETYDFPTGTKFYMDTRITLKDSDESPETNIITLQMNPTLFNKE